MKLPLNWVGSEDRLPPLGQAWNITEVSPSWSHTVRVEHARSSEAVIVSPGPRGDRSLGPAVGRPPSPTRARGSFPPPAIPNRTLVGAVPPAALARPAGRPA